ncbi:hypothetical protein PANO111632_06945 [Paracoccus nototheniae]|uniref:Uncharacterized protein n=1 Tax=Paracoccus nototheniae TaxID=2489002 RepID=A0ABW4DSU3_9RHOB|nr:hypothetical protein [Paracoccus nototheniae]
MFDIQTEAYLRRTHPADRDEGGAPIIPAAIAVSLILWTGVLISAL